MAAATDTASVTFRYESMPEDILQALLAVGSTYGPIRTSISSFDVMTNAKSFLAAVPFFILEGRKNVPVSARFSSPGDSVTVQYVETLINTKNTLAGSWVIGYVSAQVPLTADTSLIDEAGKYVAPTYVFDTFGGGHGRVRIVTNPASTFDLWSGVY